jgi:hypothetical protein
MNFFAVVTLFRFIIEKFPERIYVILIVNLSMNVYLTSFYPLCCTIHGRNAVSTFNLAPFIDGSCRREPDFQHSYPAITGLCRPRFSAKLDEGDLVIYLTNKYGVGGKFLVAILKVIKAVSGGHVQAEVWYHQNKHVPVPNNLMIDDTNYFPLEKTHKIMGWDAWVRAKTIEEWNRGYIERAASNPEVAICEFYRGPYLDNPYMLKASDFSYVFKRDPGTRNPPKLKDGEWTRFQQRILPKL